MFDPRPVAHSERAGYIQRIGIMGEALRIIPVSKLLYEHENEGLTQAISKPIG